MRIGPHSEAGGAAGGGGGGEGCSSSISPAALEEPGQANAGDCAAIAEASDPATHAAVVGSPGTVKAIHSVHVKVSELRDAACSRAAAGELPSLEKGREQIPAFLRELLLNRCSRVERKAVARFLRNKQWRCGSFCSGTESPALVTGPFSKLVASIGGDGFTFKHLFGCEKNPMKRRFIRKAHEDSVHMMFGDAKSFQGQVLKNLVDGLDVNRDDLFSEVVWAGFPCQAASSINKNRWTEQNTQCIENAELGTGEVFESILHYLRNSGAYVCFLENVYGLRGHMLQVVLAKLREAGYTVVVFETDSELYGSVQPRPRLWFACVLASFLVTISGVQELEDRPVLQRTFANFVVLLMKRFVGWKRQPIEDILLDDDSTPIKQMLAASDHRQSRSCVASVPKWVFDHAKFYSEDAGRALKWSTVQSPAAQRGLFSDSGGMSGLVDRELEGVAIEGLPLPLPLEYETAMNISQVNSRWNFKPGTVQCCTPGAKLLLLSRLRMLHGLDFLRSQSIHLLDEDDISSAFDDLELCDLAGNAFHTLPLSACLIAVVVAVSVVSTGLPALLEALEAVSVPAGDGSEHGCEDEVQLPMAESAVFGKPDSRELDVLWMMLHGD